MKQVSYDKHEVNVCLFAVMIMLLTIQNPLEGIWSGFSYIDEWIALIGVFSGAYEMIHVQKCKLTKQQLWLGIPLLIFVAAGLAGNVLYQYQPVKCVVIDLYTNLKFFFAILTGYTLFRNADWESLEHLAKQAAKLVVLLLFCIFLADRVLNIFPGEVRFRLKSATLFYSHPTYLAGAMAFLITILTAFYEKKNIPSLAMAVIMMVFTLRSKSIASAAIYLVFFVIFLVFRFRLKLWHVAVLGIVCVLIAWPQIRYYFIELGGKSTRSVMHSVALRILRDYFPIGTGFGTYASSEASKVLSPVYRIYHFDFLLRFEKNRQWLNFLNDTFWPIIIGQTGFLGTAAYCTVMFQIVRRCFLLAERDLHGYAAALFVLAYLLIASTAEPAFNNSVAIPLALMIGMIFRKAYSMKNENKEHSENG